MTPVHPGRILKRELKLRSLSANALAIVLRTPSGRVTDILNGKRGVSPETAMRLAAISATARGSGSTCRRPTNWRWPRPSLASASPPK
jgi:plasmid maintenance system antidote protein VapI